MDTGSANMKNPEQAPGSQLNTLSNNLIKLLINKTKQNIIFTMEIINPISLFFLYASYFFDSHHLNYSYCLHFFDLLVVDNLELAVVDY